MKVSWKSIFPDEVLNIDTEGTVARQRAEEDLQRIQSETPYYARLGRELREERQRNHIAERLRAAMLREHHA
jgi:hypothetical protein